MAQNHTYCWGCVKSHASKAMAPNIVIPRQLFPLVFVQSDLPLMSSGLTGQSALRVSYSYIELYLYLLFCIALGKHATTGGSGVSIAAKLLVYPFVAIISSTSQSSTGPTWS